MLGVNGRRTVALMPRELPAASKVCTSCGAALPYYGRRDLLDALHRVETLLEGAVTHLATVGTAAPAGSLLQPLCDARLALLGPVLAERGTCRMCASVPRG